MKHKFKERSPDFCAKCGYHRDHPKHFREPMTMDLAGAEHTLIQSNKVYGYVISTNGASKFFATDAVRAETIEELLTSNIDEAFVFHSATQAAKFLFLRGRHESGLGIHYNEVGWTIHRVIITRKARVVKLEKRV